MPKEKKKITSAFNMKPGDKIVATFTDPYGPNGWIVEREVPPTTTEKKE